MTDDSWQDPSKGPSKDEVAFDYIKSSDFRVIWADGAVGSITPSGNLHFALYAERPAIPRRQVFAIETADGEGGRLGQEVIDKQISRGSIVREMACDIVLNLQTAENLAKWLLSKVEEYNKLESSERRETSKGEKK